MKFMFENLFNWLNKPLIAADEAVNETRYLHGMSLDKYHYLGYTTAFYHEPGKPDVMTDQIDIFFFVDKKTSKRTYVMSGSEDKKKRFKYHSFIDRTIQLWASEQEPLYLVIKDSPSEYLKDWMLHNFDVPYFWDPYEKGWTQNTTKNKVKSNKIKITKNDGDEPDSNNVIKLEFGKKDD